MCKCVLLACIYVYPVQAVPMDDRRKHRIPRNSIGRWLQAVVVVRIELLSSGRATSVLNH